MSRKKIRITESQKNTLLREVSQSKKVKRYVTFSTVLRWYNDNKAKIASYLGVNADSLPNERELLKYTDELIKDIINPQSLGREGITDRERGIAFSAFKRIEGRLIHDILHALYNTDTKEFEKQVQDFDFTESELIEEIEVLAVEETFMKYMNIDYLKSDFINQNINQLVSYLMVTILSNEPERVIDILSGDEEPYLEVYGRKYPVKGTPYEGLFDELLRLAPNRIFQGRGEIKDEDSLRLFLAKILTHAELIEKAGGDRAFYGPNTAEEWSGGAIGYDNDGEYQDIDDALYEFDVQDYTESDLSVDELIYRIFDNEDAIAILRRTFRTTAIVRNNTRMGRGINTPAFMDLSSSYSFPSISKNLMTKNSQRLWDLLNNFRGYVIKNFEEIKKEFKDGSQKAKELTDAINDLHSSYVEIAPEYKEKAQSKDMHGFFLNLYRMTDYISKMDVTIQYRKVINAENGFTFTGHLADLSAKPKELETLNFLSRNINKLLKIHSVLATTQEENLPAIKNQMKNYVTNKLRATTGYNTVSGFKVEFDFWQDTTFIEYLKSEVGIQMIKDIVKKYNLNAKLLGTRSLDLSHNQRDKLIAIYNEGLENKTDLKNTFYNVGESLLRMYLKEMGYDDTYTPKSGIRMDGNVNLTKPEYYKAQDDLDFLNFIDYNTLLVSRG